VNSFSSFNPENILYINLMKSIFNLVLFLIVIITLVIICNNLENKKPLVSQNKARSEFTSNNIVIANVPKSHPAIVFDYEKEQHETVKNKKKKISISDQFHKDLKSGATIYPKYEPPKGEKNKEFYKKESSDQSLLFDSKLYEKKIHNERIVDREEENQLPKRIRDVYDDSITDFKALIPQMKGTNTTLISDGAFNLEAYNPDYINYENEKPENGGQIPKLYGTVYGNDPMLETGCAKF